MDSIKTDLLLENKGIMRLVSIPASKTWSIYYFNYEGERHNTHGPAIIHSSGTKMWFVNGKKHRYNGPAFVSSLGEIWYNNDMIHRLTGPAEINYELQIKLYYINNEIYTKTNYNKIMFFVRTACNIFKKKLRKVYTAKLRSLDIFNENMLYPIVSAYII